MLPLDTADPPADVLNLNLSAIRTEGLDALDPKSARHIRRIILRKIKYAQQNTLHELVTREADDLFAGPPGSPPPQNPLPPGATPLAATLAFHLDDTTETDAVDLSPPSTVRVTPEGHARTIIAWLSQSCLNAAHKITHLRHH